LNSLTDSYVRVVRTENQFSSTQLSESLVQANICVGLHAWQSKCDKDITGGNAMVNAYKDGVEIWEAALKGARTGFEKTLQSESGSSCHLRRSSWLVAAAVGIGTVAACAGHFRGLKPEARRVIQAFAAVLAVVAAWDSRVVVSTVLEPTSRAVKQTRDQQWLRVHPINYA
jgi:hypothetical protein